MIDNWQVWLNTNVNITSKIIIGKNIYFQGNPERLMISKNISIIGYSRIYNESALWDILEMKNDNPKKHSLQILIELYKKFGFEEMLELLEGEFSFLLLDYNIHGDESWLYLARDPFGIYPLYYYENVNQYQKKVQFEIEPKIYGFSSMIDSTIFQNQNTPFLSGHYQRFSHSHKVSSIWKRNYRPKLFYKLPFFSIYDNENVKKIEDQNIKIKIAIDKRIKWILYKNPELEKIKIGVLCLNSDKTNDFLNKFTKNEEYCEFIPILPLNIQNGDDSVVFECSKFITSVGSIFQIEYMEKEYPTIITRIKKLLNSNDPYVIRSHFIPIIISKYISENLSDIKHIFLGEEFTLDWIEKKYLERCKRISNIYLDENMKGWANIISIYGIEIYMPFLDRVLMQDIKPNGYL